MIRAVLFALPMMIVAGRIMPAESATGIAFKESSQFGAKRLDFMLGNSPAFLIVPARMDDDAPHPWVWYAPTFIGRHPDESHTWLFEQLLAAGFHIGGIEIGETYGNAQGRRTFQMYYEFVVREFALSKQPCLMPQSRGGLMLYNWAVEHPDSVACVAGIYTVCNLESYPGLAKAAPAYGMSELELEERLEEHNPVSRVGSLAKAGVAIFHIHGDADAVVPLEANAGMLVDRHRRAGGEAVLVVVPGKGHEVCDAFFKSAELLAFILENGKPNPGLSGVAPDRQLE